MSGKKKGNKLKLDKLVSVDLCQQGANPDADICLFKSAQGEPPATTDPVPPASTAETDVERSIVKRMVDAIYAAFAKPLPEEVEKDAQSFNNITARQEVDENLWKYLRAFEESVNSIVRDGDIEAAQKNTKLNETLSQFSDKMQSLFPVLVGVSNTEKNDEPGEVDKSKEEGDDNMDFNFDNIDKSKLTAEELEQFQGLAKKCMTEPQSDPTPAADPAPVDKSKTPEGEPEINPALAKALEKIESLTKSMEANTEKQERAQALEVAKKYINLGEKPEELADTLYDLKKSNEKSYDALINSLDKALESVNKSGIFGEIGKNTHGNVPADAEAKLTGIAKGFMKDDPKLDFNSAMVKACDENPELRAEYENQ